MSSDSSDLYASEIRDKVDSLTKQESSWYSNYVPWIKEVTVDRQSFVVANNKAKI